MCASRNWAWCWWWELWWETKHFTQSQAAGICSFLFCGQLLTQKTDIWKIDSSLEFSLQSIPHSLWGQCITWDLFSSTVGFKNENAQSFTGELTERTQIVKGVRLYSQWNVGFLFFFKDHFVIGNRWKHFSNWKPKVCWNEHHLM